MKLTLPELCLVLLVGPSGAGKTTFARRHFKPTEIVSSDACRAMVADDENDQSATAAAFEIAHLIAARRLAAGRLTVVDATNIQPEARRPLIQLAREHHCPVAAVVFDLPETLCLERHRQRRDRDFGEEVIAHQRRLFERSVHQLEREGVRHVHVYRSPDALDGLTVVRQRLWNNRRHEHGPFDIVGDVHGCYEELRELIDRLGYTAEDDGGRIRLAHPAGRKLVFVGDLVDRGPDTPAVLELVMDAVEDRRALCVSGNHDAKLLRKLHGRDVKLTNGLAASVEQLAARPESFRRRAARFLERLTDHYVLDHGRLVVAHAGLPENMHGRASGKVREFALYGDTTGEFDAHGYPIRRDWAADYRGRALVVYGHTPMLEAGFVNNTLCVDTGCVFGGKLTALRYPEREIVSVPARREYYPLHQPLQKRGEPAAPATAAACAAGTETPGGAGGAPGPDGRSRPHPLEPDGKAAAGAPAAGAPATGAPAADMPAIGKPAAGAPMA